MWLAEHCLRPSRTLYKGVSHILCLSSSVCSIQERKNMDKVVYIYALLGLFAGSIFSSCICGTSTKFDTHSDCNLFGSIIEKSVSNAIETIYIGILILGIKFVNNLFSICYKESASYTMVMPFWIAFALSYICMSN
ncbi:uncharacterized protein LOC110266397 isoform X2 [Arachis ipaensis]|nr:uncharacterized protein LOC110266397 isoform X2 [Arachis ipaensis]XP_025677570.1 uncharacterized protein LOC112777416 isoform X2 [Arachis hypogaea]